MAEDDGESVAVMVRRLIRAEAQRRGLWPESVEPTRAQGWWMKKFVALARASEPTRAGGRLVSEGEVR
jgi:hypothetical protein